jgi:hypothetical protein
MLSSTPVIFGIDPYVESAYQEHQLGAVGFTADGRKFHYAKAGASLTAGNLIQAPAQDTGEQNLAPAANAAIGATSVSVTCGGTVAANLFTEGYLVITVTPGNGLYYRIKKHDALASATATTFELYDPLKIAITAAASKIDLVMNPYKNVIQNPSSATAAPVGVTLIAATSTYYFWVQSGGVAPVLAQGTLTVGNLVVASNGTAGAVENAANSSTEAQAVVGVATTGVATGENGGVNLMLP